MGSNDEFGPDTDAIRAWLEKRRTYADDDLVGRRGDLAPPTTSERPMPAPSPPSPHRGPDVRDAGRSVIAALTDDGPTEPTGSRWTAPDRATRSSVGDVEFRRRGTARRVAGVALLACLCATGYAAFLAATDRDETSIALAVALGVVTLVVWAARTGMGTTQLAIHRGRLEVRRGGTVDVVDLGNPYTPVAVLGEPGDRGWCVLIERVDQPLLVVGPRMVEPDRFTEALCRLRPDVAAGPRFRPRR